MAERGRQILVRLSAGVAAIALAGLVASHAPAAAVTDSSARLYQEAVDLLDKGDGNAAFVKLRNAVKADPENAAARFELARLHLLRGDVPSAEKEARAALARDFDRAKIEPLLGEILLIAGNAGDALELLTGEAGDADDRATVRAMRARAFLMLRDVDAAATEISAGDALGGQSVLLEIVASHVEQMRGDLDAAEARADRALALAPDFEEAILQQAELRRLAGDNAAAVAGFTRLLEKSPTHHRARGARALAFAAMGEDAKARQDAETVLERDPLDPIASYVKALALTRADDLAGAKAALLASPASLDYAPGLFLKASLDFALGDLADSRVALGRFRAVAPESRAGIILAAAIALKDNDPLTAERLLAPVVAAAPNDPRGVALLASAYEALGRPAAASALVSRLADAEPTDEARSLDDARLALAAGRSAEGIEGLELIAKGSRPADASALLALAHAARGDYVKARAAADRLVEAAGRTAITENLYAAVALMEGDRADARRRLEAALALDAGFTAAAINLARLDRIDGNTAAAYDRYASVLKAAPTELRALLGIASLARSAAEMDAALSRFETAVTEAPKDDAIAAGYVSTLIDWRMSARALTVARAAAARMPEKPAVLTALARAESAEGLVSSAVTTRRRIVALRPADIQSRLDLAATLIADKAYGEAATVMDEALRLAPHAPELVRLRLDVEVKAKGLDAAMPLVDRLYKDMPNQRLAKLERSRLLAESGRPKDAIRDLAALYDETKSAAALLPFYAALRAAGDVKTAEAALKAHMAAYPGAHEVERFWFTHLISVRRFEEATAVGEALAEADPRNAVVLNNLAWLYGEAGRREDARRLAEEAHLLSPEEPSFADTLGWLLLQDGELQRARTLLGRAAASAPDNPDIAFHYAAALERTGAEIEAIAMLDTLLSAGADFDARKAAEALRAELAQRTNR